MPFFAGAPGGNRTPDLDVRTVLLYPLSYGGLGEVSKNSDSCALRAPGALSYAGLGEEAKNSDSRVLCAPGGL